MRIFGVPFFETRPPSPLEQASERLRERVEKKLTETTLDLSQSLVDPFELLRDPADPFTQWMQLGAAGISSPLDFSHFRTELELTRARNYCRLLARINPFCINGHENRISYIVGTGHTYLATAKAGAELNDETKEKIQGAIDDFIKANRWQARQQEIVRRGDRDGEVFIRKFEDPDGPLRVRFIEPDQVTTPGDIGTDITFGIETEPDDVETPVAYWVARRTGERPERIDAFEIQHRKYNVDVNVRRGSPLFYAARDLLLKALKILMNIAATSDIQTAIALIRRHTHGTQAGTEIMRANAADFTRSNPLTGMTDYIKRWRQGTIIDASANVEYDFPAAGINVTQYAAGVAALLRAIASLLVMPEFMLSSDASNSNYSSTLVAEGPAVKKFNRDQAAMREADLELINDALRHRAARGDFPVEVLDDLEIQVGMPSVMVRNKKDEAEVSAIEYDKKILSPQTWAARADLDYEQEMKNIAEHNANYPPQAPQLLGPDGKPINGTAKPREVDADPAERDAERDGDEDPATPGKALESANANARALAIVKEMLGKGYPHG